MVTFLTFPKGTCVFEVGKNEPLNDRESLVTLSYMDSVLWVTTQRSEDSSLYSWQFCRLTQFVVKSQPSLILEVYVCTSV